MSLKNRRIAWLAACLAVLTVSVVSAGSASASPPDAQLDVYAREKLRSRLETLFNEQDLLIKNQRVDRGDLAHQRQEFDALKVFVRIPFKPDLAGLQKDLRETAGERKLSIESFQRLPAPHSHVATVPDWIYTDGPVYRLTDDQLAEKIPFRIVVKGAGPNTGLDVRHWVESWTEDQMRLAQFDGPTLDRSLRDLGGGRWEVQGHAFRFREVKFPQLRARDPLALLPNWAARNPGRFAETEPRLWNYVTRIKQIAPQAEPLYPNHSELLLNSQRMSFYIAHGTRPSSQTAKE